MNGLPYYKAYPRDFVEGTIGMRFELKAAYRLVLDLIYMQGGQLPDDPRYISGLLGLSMRKWKSLRSELVEMDKIQVSGEFLSSRLCERWQEQAQKDEKRPAIPTAIQQEVRERDGDACKYCGDTKGPFHLDHILPWSRGGDHSPENLTVACAKCNWSKGAMTLAEWQGVLQ